MDDRLLHLVRSLRERFRADTDLDEVIATLSAEGYDRRQISEIVTHWKGEHEPVPAPVPAGQVLAPLRMLGPHEWGRFSPEAWGRLVALQGSGALSILDLERVMEHALEQGEGRVALPELNAILDVIGLGSPEPGPGADPVTFH